MRDLSTVVMEKVSPDGPPDGAAGVSSLNAAISGDGRHVAFEDYFKNVFVHDRVTGQTELVSGAPGGASSNGPSGGAAISADGRYVAFQSLASNLVPGDSNGLSDIFVRDRLTDRTEIVSVSSEGDQASGILPTLSAGSLAPAISGNGRFVTFASSAANLVPGDTNGNMDVFVHDRQTGITERVSVAADGSDANLESASPSISADGRYVAFRSSASNLVPSDTNGPRFLSGPYIYNASVADVFVYDRLTETTQRVSVASDGSEANGMSEWPVISADGRFVAFESLASNLVPSDTNDVVDVFIHDRLAGTTERISVGSDLAQANRGSFSPTISGDGGSVGFHTSATNLVAGVPDPDAWDVYVRERGAPLGIVGGVSVSKLSGRLATSGQATFSGEVLRSSIDPDDDGGDGALPLGAELVAAAVVFRPEAEDLLLRLDLSSFPAIGGGVPEVLYGAEFTVGGTRYEVRASRAAAAVVPPSAPYAAIYRCAAQCVEQVRLSASFGSTGQEVRVAIPLASFEGNAGVRLDDLRAFTALGDPGSGSLKDLDEVVLGDGTIPTPRVELAIAPASVAEDNVGFATTAHVSAGNFYGEIPTASLPPGSYRVWARACLATSCGPGTFKAVVL